MRGRAGVALIAAGFAVLTGCSMLHRHGATPRHPSSGAPATTVPYRAPRRTGPGFPALADTGVPAGTPLRATGPITVRTNGAVIDGVNATTEINVEADNVTIRYSRLLAAGQWGIIQRQGHTGLRVEDTEILGDGLHQVQFGILNQGVMLTVERVHIHTVSDGIQTDQGLVADSLIDGLKEFPGDHCVNILSNGSPDPGTSLIIKHNTLLNPLEQTAAVALYQDFSRAYDATVEGNYLAGGGYALYGGAGRHGRPSNIKILNNVFSRRYHPGSGVYGPVIAYVPGPGNAWRGNVFDSGTPVSPS